MTPYLGDGGMFIKELCLLFLPNVPGAMVIQGGTFIPDSRVGKLCTNEPIYVSLFSSAFSGEIVMRKM